ncbi:MAG: hypothetical protein AAFO02_03630 [Bacteroidota bacterium]
MRIQILALFLLLGLAACQKPVSPLGIAGDYYPPTEELRSGIVNKYYLHYKSNDKYTEWTDMAYYLYELNRDSQLQITHYDPGFQPYSRFLTIFRAGEQVVLLQEQYWRTDSFPGGITKVVMQNWQGDTSLYQATTTYDGEIIENFSLRQRSQRDSLADGRHLKIFEYERQRTYDYPDEDQRKMQAEITRVFAQGLGLYSSTVKLEEGTLEMELVEQLPATLFRKRQAAAPKRVAYIDPAQVLDKGTDFTPCDEDIIDYYNGDPDAGPIGGKRRLWKLFEQLDPKLLNGQSGYLTFRFVINCEGVAGYFITEEAGLDFVRKRFPEPLVRHVFDLLRQFQAWQPTEARGEVYDSYAYITLKLKDGKLVEILP